MNHQLSSPIEQRTRVIVTSALKMSQLATQIPKVKYELREQEWTTQREELLQHQSEILAVASARLAEAAKQGDMEDVTRIFNNVENSCNSCHASFRSDLLTIVDKQ
jgi:cytochrome c556